MVTFVFTSSIRRTLISRSRLRDSKEHRLPSKGFPVDRFTVIGAFAGVQILGLLALKRLQERAAFFARYDGIFKTLRYCMMRVRWRMAEVSSVVFEMISNLCLLNMRAQALVDHCCMPKISQQGLRCRAAIRYMNDPIWPIEACEKRARKITIVSRSSLWSVPMSPYSFLV